MVNDSGKNSFLILRKHIDQERKLLKEIESIYEEYKEQDRSSHIDPLIQLLKKTNDNVPRILKKISITKSVPSKPAHIPKMIRKEKVKKIKKLSPIEIKKQREFEEFERETLKRLRKKEKKPKRREGVKKPSKYVKVANKMFHKMSIDLLHKKIFRSLRGDLIKANLSFLPTSYVSVILFTIFLSAILAFFIFIFFLFFNISAEIPFITLATESFGLRLLKTFWIIIAIPLATFLFLYFYPSLERKASSTRVDQELPFVAIHMSAISESMVEPSKIFSIIVSTKEYPYIEKEFIKLINKLNVYGYDLISALRDSAFNTGSKKLADLYNGIATTITSGGDLSEFFDKRAQTLLFEYRLEREKYTRTAETFMDIYISVVIAAPMIFMLLLMMIKISGLGIALSTGAITLIMILGVSIINIIFLTFLQLKQPVR